jgi:hypothetical protein
MLLLYTRYFQVGFQNNAGISLETLVFEETSNLFMVPPFSVRCKRKSSRR